MSTELNLFQLEQEYLHIADQLVQGELTPELEQALELNKENFEVKSAKYAYVTKKFDGEIFLIDKEIERLTGLKTTRERAITKLKDTVKAAMDLYGIKKIEAQNIKLMLVRSKPSVEVDEKLLPKKYFKKKVTPVTYTPDKVLIKADLDAGKKIKGASLKENENLQIK